MQSDTDLIALFQSAALEIGNHNFEGLALSTDIADLGIDSVELLEIFGEIEEELDIQMSDEDLAGLSTLGDLVALIRRA